MKYLMLVSSLSFLLSSCAQTSQELQKSGVKTEFSHSEAASYLHFLDSGFDEPHTSGSLKELIKQKRIFHFKKQDNLSRFNLFKSYLRNGYSFPSIPARPRGVFGEDTLNKLAVTSFSIEDFEKSLSAVLPYDGINAYFELKDVFYNKFRETVWNPSLKFQKKGLAQIQKTIESTGFRDQLKLARKFYRSNYPRQLPLKVGLIPILDSDLESKHTSALNLGDIQIVPYMVSKGASSGLDVVFHEFCHAFFKGQSLKIQKTIEQFYFNHPSKHALFVYRYLDESLATAWGNGWYGEIKEGKLSSKSWYTVSYIDILAKKILPLIKNYTERGKLLDEKFMAETIAIAESVFPKAPREMKANIMALKVLSNTKAIPISSLSHQLRKKFRIHWMKRSYPMTNSDLDALDKKTFYTTLIISAPEKDQVRKIKRKLGLRKLPLAKDFLAIIPKNKKYFFWIHSSNKSKINKAISKLEDKVLLDTKTEIIRL